MLYARLRRMSSTNKAKKYLAAQYEDLQITRGDGPYVFAADGRRYIDFVMGWCVGNLGWGMDTIRDKINATNHAPYVHPELLYRPWVDVAALLAELTPGELQLSYRATGGTEAVEIALQVSGVFGPQRLSLHRGQLPRQLDRDSQHWRVRRSEPPFCAALQMPQDQATAQCTGFGPG